VPGALVHELRELLDRVLRLRDPDRLSQDLEAPRLLDRRQVAAVDVLLDLVQRRGLVVELPDGRRDLLQPGGLVFFG
jgi:hypothetical protein